jgi:hypothetical protein
MLKQIDAWALAAAILLKEGHELHYNDLTSRILQTELTGLAETGKTPKQTLGVILRTHKLGDRQVFKRTGGGFYDLRDPALTRRINLVKRANELLELTNSNSRK